jgi:hypothetical protein
MTRTSAAQQPIGRFAVYYYKARTAVIAEVEDDHQIAMFLITMI